MSNEPIGPKNIVSDGVKDGVEEDGKPVPRNGGNTDGAATPSDVSQLPQADGTASESSASEGTVPGTKDTHKVPGPAEEEDEKSADDRGLTTDTSPD